MIFKISNHGVSRKITFLRMKFFVIKLCNLNGIHEQRKLFFIYQKYLGHNANILFTLIQEELCTYICTI